MGLFDFLKNKKKQDTAPQEPVQEFKVVPHADVIERFNADLQAIERVPVNIAPQKISRRRASDMPALKFSNITKKTNLEKLFPLVVIDTETTGIKIAGNYIVEISAIKYESWFSPSSCFTTLIKPRNPIPPEASAVNHITDEMVADSPAFSDILDSFNAYISGCNIVGHNLAFDLKFMYVLGFDIPEDVKFFDTLELAKRVLKTERSEEYDHHEHTYKAVEDYDVEDYKLETLCSYYGIYREDAHRSLSDCYATAKLFKDLIEDKTL